MRLPVDTTIAEEKLMRYLLLPQVRGDKSAFLAQAGYILKNAGQLLHDLRTQIVSVDAVQLESNKFGQILRDLWHSHWPKWREAGRSHHLDD